ncbi:hypothetical protein YTPLAS18_28730 [Nitrospira sp.]|nr:hypothetical protein YTPLAS18_28730 [Nitrospira sp.]
MNPASTFTILRVIFAAVLLLQASGCAINPVSGRPEVMLITEEQEKKIGAEEAEKVEQQMGLVPDVAFTSYLNLLGKRLAEASPRPALEYRFYVADMVEPNAFALPGGHIYVSRGILTLANSEDELAGVVGHEVGHVAGRHSVQAMSKRAPFAVVFGIASGLAGIVSPFVGNIIGGIGDITESVIFSPYSRSQETEADRVGQEMAARAGWDPSGLTKLLHSLDREVKLYEGGKRRPSFFDTHPPTPDRVERTAAHAKNLSKASIPPISSSSEDFIRRLDGLVVGPRAANGIVHGTSFLHPDLNVFIGFPEGWKIQNSPQKIIAAAPDGEAAVVTGAVAEGNDPIEGARLLEKKSKQKSIVSQTTLTTINGLPAARTQLHADSKVTIDFTWIAYGGVVYQVAALAASKQFDTLKPIFHRVADSFRPLTALERSSITETRIRLVTGREGETIGALKQRTGSAWSEEEIAVANGLEVSDKIRGGQLLKVAKTEPYTSNK